MSTNATIIEEFKNASEKLFALIDDIDENVTIHDDRIIRIEDKLSCIDESLSSISDSVSTLDEIVDRITPDLNVTHVTDENINDWLDDYVLSDDLPDFDDLDERISSLEDKVDCYYTVDELSDRIDELYGKLDDIFPEPDFKPWTMQFVAEAFDSHLCNYVTHDSMLDTFKGLHSGVAENKGNICELQAKNDYLCKQIAFLYTQNQELEKRIERMEAPIRAIESILEKSANGIGKLLAKVKVGK